jgi:transcriptional regulator with XRE-family HTH domain
MVVQVFSRRVQRLRKALGLSQEKLAQLIGVSFRTVNRWEADANSPTGHTALVIECLEKIVVSGRGPALLQELRSGSLAGGTGLAYQRIFTMAFGLPEGTSKGRRVVKA